MAALRLLFTSLPARHRCWAVPQRLPLTSSRTCSPGVQVLQRQLSTTSLLYKPEGMAHAAAAPDEYPTDHAQIQSPGRTPYFVDNQFKDSKASSWIDLHDPATNNLVTRVPQSTDEELHAAVESASKAFPTWRATSLLHRQQIMFKFVALIRQHWDRLAASITLEQGKTFADAKGDVLRGLQVAETACGITTQLTGEVLEVAKDMETRSYKEPLGVVAAICPFSAFTPGRLNDLGLRFRQISLP